MCVSGLVDQEDAEVGSQHDLRSPVIITGGHGGASRRLRPNISRPVAFDPIPRIATRDFVMTTLHEQHSSRPRRPLRRVFAFLWLTLAVAAMVLAGFHVHYATLEPSPYDLRVLGQFEWLPGTEAAIHLRVCATTACRSGACRSRSSWPVRTRAVAVQLAGLKTGDHGEGVPRFRLPDWPDGSYQLRVTASPAGARRPETVTQTIALNHSWRLMTSTDKPVYQPGQVIHIRGLALRRPDLKPVVNQVMAFSLTDLRGNVVFRDRRPTSRFGIALGRLPVGRRADRGELPRRVPRRRDDQPGDGRGQELCPAPVQGRPHAGSAVLPAGPAYQGTRPGRLYLRQAGRRRRGDRCAGVNRRRTEGPSNARAPHRREGRGGIRASLARDADRPRARFGQPRVAITVMVRDPAGQIQERTEPRVVAVHPIRIEVIPEAGRWSRALPNTIHLLVTTLDGRPVRARLTVSGLDRELNTSELGVTSFEVTPRSNTMRWTIQARDDQGRIGRRQVLLTRGALAGDYLFRTDKAVYDGGEPVRVTVLAGGVDPVFIDLVKDGQTVLGDTIEIAQGRGERTIDLPPELFGTVVLHAYRYVTEGLPVQESRVIHIRPARALTITATADRAEYRPGERASLSFAMTDEHGKPAPGAISLAAVDEAVFGMLDRRFGLERTFFTLDPELLKPVYEIEDWSPYEDEAGDVVRAAPRAERARFEQALFARTAQGPSPHSPVVSSYSESVAEFESIRFEALQMIGLGWAVLVLVALVGGLAWLFLYRLRSVGCLATIAIIIVAWNFCSLRSNRQSRRHDAPN